MNLLDMRTIIFSHVVTDIVCLLVILMLWHQSRKRFAGMSFWVFDFALQTAAMFLIISRGSIPDWMSMVLANTLVLGGAILGYMGLGRFVGKKISQVHNYLLLAAFACVHAYFTFVQPNQAARNLNVTVGLLIICFQCLWLLIYRAESGMRALTLGVGMVFGGYCLVSIIRIFGSLTGTLTANDFFQSGAFESFILISYQMLFILLTYSLALMVNKRLLGEVKAQEEKFVKAFQSSPYAIMLTRLSDGQIIEVNDGFANISRYPHAEAIGKTTIDLHLWDKEEDRVVAVEELSSSGRVRGREFQFRKKSGEMLTGLFSADIISISNQKCVLSSISDITERKRAEEALRQSEERWATTLASIGDAVIATDVAGRITFMNGIAETLTSWTLREASMKPVAEVFHIVNEQTRQKVESPVAKVLEKGNIVDLANHTVLVRKDGTEVPIDDSGAPIKGQDGKTSGVVLVFRDITERRKTERALRESEAKANALIQYAPTGIYEIDYRGPRFINVNDAMCQILGYTREELFSIGPGALLDEKSRALFGDRIRRQLAGEKIEESVEYRVRKKDGSFIDAILNVSLNLRGGEPGRALVVAHDITERKRAEEALRKAHDELEIRVRERTEELAKSQERLQHLASKLLIAQEQERKRVAVELHDGLLSELAATKFLLEGKLALLEKGKLSDPGEFKRVSDILTFVIKEARRIMNNLHPSVLDELGLIAAIHWLSGEYQKSYPHIKVQKQLEISEEDISDSIRVVIFRVLQEALNNFAKHGKGDRVALSLTKSDHTFAFLIRDNGQGFDVEKAPKGVGLESMRERVELSGGEFQVESILGQGTTIRAIWRL